MNRGIRFGIGVFLGALSAFIVALVIHTASISEAYREAAKAGVGQYVADPVTGETRWEWKDCKGGEE